jgi:conjugal transfer pilus assembly protein TraU
MRVSEIRRDRQEMSAMAMFPCVPSMCGLGRRSCPSRLSRAGAAVERGRPVRSAQADTGVAAASVPAKCTGRFVNPITDVCWSCLFPLSVGALKIFPASVPTPTTLASGLRLRPLPRIGFAFGFWEPVGLPMSR